MLSKLTLEELTKAKKTPRLNKNHLRREDLVTGRTVTYSLFVDVEDLRTRNHESFCAMHDDDVM